MWENTNGEVAGSVFTRGRWSPDVPMTEILPGSPIAANVNSGSVPFVLRSWYRDTKGDLRQMKFDSLQGAWDFSEYIKTRTVSVRLGGSTTNMNNQAGQALPLATHQRSV